MRPCDIFVIAQTIAVANKYVKIKCNFLFQSASFYFWQLSHCMWYSLIIDCVIISHNCSLMKEWSYTFMATWLYKRAIYSLLWRTTPIICMPIHLFEHSIDELYYEILTMTSYKKWPQNIISKLIMYWVWSPRDWCAITMALDLGGDMPLYGHSHMEWLQRWMSVGWMVSSILQ